MSQILAERAANSLLRSRSMPTLELMIWIIAQRDDLAKRATRTFTLLFTTLSLLTLVMFGQTKEFALLGIKVEDSKFFVFGALVVGNLLYVVSTGLFAKTITMEFFLLKLSEIDYFQFGKSCTRFMACHPLNLLAYIRLEGFNDAVVGVVKNRIITCVNFYSKYMMIVGYGIFFYTILIIFLSRLWEEGTNVALIYFGILTFLNVMTIVTSASVFLFLSQSRIRLIETIDPLQHAS